MHKRVKVCVRVRPNTRPNSSVVVNASDQTISVLTNPQNGTGTCFHFDQILAADVNQSKTFASTAAEVVENVMSGYNGTIMAYGQTGAGKTYTMSGGKRNFEDRGIIARAISSIFQQIHRDATYSYAVRVSYVEVYNENLYDLLNFQEPDPSTHRPHSSNNNHHQNSKEDLVIQENEKGQTFIRGLTRPLVQTEEAALDLLFQGDTNRTIAEHCLNASSTRSHCIFTVYLEKKPTSLEESLMADGQIVYSKLNLVDLAGSERMKKTGVAGNMLKEASHINKSLTFLEQVVIALADKKRQHIPYRQTTLTNLLKDSLGGNCRTLLIACVWPDDAHNDQSIATLKFATRMMRVKTSAIVNVVQTANGGTGSGGMSSEEVAKYVQEIKRLKEELAMHDVISGRNHVEYDKGRLCAPAQQEIYKLQVKAFLQDPDKNPLPLVNVTQIQQLFRAFRDVYLSTTQSDGRIAWSTSDSDHGATLVASKSESKMVQNLRNLRASSPSYASDRAQSSPRPPPPPALSSEKTKLPLMHATRSSPVARVEKPAEATRLPQLVAKRDEEPQVLSEKELFEEFKRQENPRPESILDLEVAKQNLRTAKTQMAAYGMEVNRLKAAIDELTLKYQQSQQENTDDTTSKAQELVMIKLREAKRQYREQYECFQEKKAETTYLTKIKDQMLQQVTREFEEWKRQRPS